LSYIDKIEKGGRRDGLSIKFFCRSQEIRTTSAGLDLERSSFPKRYENMDSRLSGLQRSGSGGENRRRYGASEEKEVRPGGQQLDATYQEIPEPMEEGQFHRDR
jgi:hypothetical protein